MSLRTRIEDWLKSANCNCTTGVYCTYCEILTDVLEYMDAAEEANNVESDSVVVEVSAGAVQLAEAEAGAGESPGASGREEGARPAEPKGEEVNGCQTCFDDESLACDDCGTGFR